MDYLDEKDIPAPTGRDNKVVDNIFYTDDPEVKLVKNDLKAADRPTFIFENNSVEPLANF